MPNELSPTLEGRTRLFVPSGSLSARVPATYPVFFNPAARLNRDISVAVARVTRPESYLDVLAGVGARGVRVANEAGESTSVTLADFNESSLAVAKKNVGENGLDSRVSVVHREANSFLYSRFDREEKFAAIDVDPFGSPAPYMQGAALACADGAMLSFTATDAAVLCAVYPSVASRRYGVSVVRSEFVHETALRVLIGFAVRAAGLNDIGVTPVAAHSTLHYLRVFVRMSRGASPADMSMKELGYVTQCNGCGERTSSKTQLTACPHCSTKVRSSGPLWVGPVVDWKTVGRSASFCSKEGWSEAEETLSALEGFDEFPPYSYSLERACSKLGNPSVQVEKVRASLRSRGFASLVAPFDEIALKTTAGYQDLLEAVKEASSLP